MSTLTQLRAVLRDHDADAILAALAEAGLQIKPLPGKRVANPGLAFHEAFQQAKREACAELGWRDAAAEKRIKTRKRRGMGIVKVWIEPTRQRGTPRPYVEGEG